MKTSYPKLYRKYTKAELFYRLTRCPQFCQEKRGARELLGIAAKDTLIEYCLEYHLIES